MSRDSNPKAPLLKHLGDVEEIVAADLCRLREILHPARDPVQIRYSLARAIVDPGESTLEHHINQSEVYYVISGEGTMHLDGREYPVRAGSAYYIPPGCRQYLVNTTGEPFEFLCIVDPPWTAEGETVVCHDKT